MSQSPTFPMYWDTWATCGTCGFVLPSKFVVQTRKHGVQCLAGSGRTRGCFDGNYDRDDIYFVYPDDEGTRDTAAPLADQLRGFEVTIYVLRDSATGILYAIDFATAPYVLVEIALADVDPDTMNGPFDWLEGTNLIRIYVANAALTFGYFNTIYCPSAPGAIQTTPTFAPSPVQFGAFLLYDRAFPDDVYALTFADEITVFRAAGTAAAGIELNDGWIFFLEGDGSADTAQAKYDQNSYSGTVPWDNSHTFYVNGGDPEQPLLYAP